MRALFKMNIYLDEEHKYLLEKYDFENEQGSTYNVEESEDYYEIFYNDKKSGKILKNACKDILIIV